MNRYDFQHLASVRLKDARALLREGRYDACYYLTGYVVECALKACIAKQTRRYDFPDRDLFNRAYTHDLGALLRLAQLELDLDLESTRNREFGLNWLVVKEWRENSRYTESDRQRAQDLLRAVADQKHGVLRWIKQHW